MGKKSKADYGDKTKMAHKLGISPAYVTLLLQGRRQMSKSLMIRLEQQTGVEFKVWMEATPEQLSKLLKHHFLTTR